MEKGDLANAIALNSALFNVARLIGPGLAGLLIPWVGEEWCFLGNAFAGLAIVAALYAIHFDERHVRKVSGLSIFREIRQGLGYVRRLKRNGSVALAGFALCAALSVGLVAARF